MSLFSVLAAIIIGRFLFIPYRLTEQDNAWQNGSDESKTSSMETLSSMKSGRQRLCRPGHCFQEKDQVTYMDDLLYLTVRSCRKNASREIFGFSRKF